MAIIKIDSDSFGELVKKLEKILAGYSDLDVQVEEILLKLTETWDDATVTEYKNQFSKIRNESQNRNYLLIQLYKHLKVVKESYDQADANIADAIRGFEK